MQIGQVFVLDEVLIFHNAVVVGGRLFGPIFTLFASPSASSFWYIRFLVVVVVPGVRTVVFVAGIVFATLFLVVVFVIVHRSPSDNQFDSGRPIQLVFRQKGKALANRRQGWIVALFCVDWLGLNVLVFVVVFEGVLRKVIVLLLLFGSALAAFRLAASFGLSLLGGGVGGNHRLFFFYVLKEVFVAEFLFLGIVNDLRSCSPRATARGWWLCRIVRHGGKRRFRKPGSSFFYPAF
mmetsp:Transcript_5965/g.14450  ORF Transcript_5965/g.14450 Transcript_5965/m.14450 type:complete len:236 (-) Transcript_5965:59-766(-)